MSGVETETLTLSAFLLARLAEDEAAAKFVAVERIDWAPTGLPVTAMATVDTDQGLWYLAIDPDRVLAEVEAKRRVVAEHAEGDAGYCRRCHGEDIDIGGPQVWMYPKPIEYPCLTLRALASIYASHDDYDPEWSL